MRIQSIIYQNISQLKWYILACVGLVMTIPVEDVIVSFINDHEFYNVGTGLITVYFTPFLAGLIACANVQADLDEKRYVFWRSKPANVKLLMALKFFVGLIISFILMACPVVFMVIIKYLSKNSIRDLGLQAGLPMPIFLILIIYSLCFASNVLIRNTARAWLIGILLTGFLLILPFILPLNYRDFMNDKDVFGLYLVIMLIATGASFVFSLFAVQHDWHLKTNLKGLLWVIAGLVFVLFMLFSSQVANIKVLDEKEVTKMNWWQSPIDNIDGRLVLHSEGFINIENNKISFNKFDNQSDIAGLPAGTDGEYRVSTYPERGRLIKKFGEKYYNIFVSAYYRLENIHTKPEYIYEHAFLRILDRKEMPFNYVKEFDLTEYPKSKKYNPNISLYSIDDKLIIFIDDSYVIADITNPEEASIIETKHNVLKNRFSYYEKKSGIFNMPLLSIEGMSIEERIKLSIDRNYNYNESMFDASIVDINNGRITFYVVSLENITKYEVVNHDSDNIYFKLKDLRQLTILENLTGTMDPRNSFVKDGKLYCSGVSTLMVFDIRSNDRIRKLGHFVRMDYRIEDIAVLEDGNILLYLLWAKNFGPQLPDDNIKGNLYLLKAP